LLMGLPTNCGIAWEESYSLNLRHNLRLE